MKRRELILNLLVLLVPAGSAGCYGLNENRKQDEQYREAYMRSRGYHG